MACCQGLCGFLMAYKTLIFAVVLSFNFLPVECPALPISPSPTDGLNKPYVTSEEENESCFSESGKPIPEGLYLRCGPGYHAQIGDRYTPCLLCRHDETLQTYQPKESHCEKCILCTNCSALGMEVEVNCTLTTDTVCKDVTPVDSDGASTTAADVQHSPSPSKPLDVPSATSPIPQRNETDPCPPCICEGHSGEKHTSWIMPVLVVVLAVTIILLLCFAFYKRKTYKSKIGELEKQIRNLQSQLEEANSNLRSRRIVDNHQDNHNTSQDHEDIALNHIDAAEAVVDNGPRSTDPLLPDDGPGSTFPLLSGHEDTGVNHIQPAEPEETTV